MQRKTNKKGNVIMNAQQIWDCICQLANSQGIYSRLKENILNSGQKDEILAKLESMNFKDIIEFIDFVER